MQFDPRFEYPQMTRKFLTPALAGILFALKIFQKEFYCQDCQFTWAETSSGRDTAFGSASFRARAARLER